MMDWWIQQTLSLQIFYAVGIVSGILLVIEVVLTLLGLDHHNLPDVGVDHPDGLGFLSVRTITGFFFGFGWSGAIAMKNGLSVPLAIAVSCAVGAAFLFGIYALMRALFSMRASGNLDYRNALGRTATVYVTIPPAHTGSGQIEILLQGRLSMVSAMTKLPTALPPQTKVRVTELVDQNTLDVEPV